MDPLRRKSAWSIREVDYVSSDTGSVSQSKAPVCFSAFEGLEKLKPSWCQTEGERKGS
jgi:hypothetical protein